jgi:hypothetical protein
MLTLLYLLTFALLLSIGLIMIWRHGILYFPLYFYLYLAIFHALIPLMLLAAEDVFLPIMRRPALLEFMTPEHYLVALFLVATAALTFPLGWKLGGKAPLLVLRRSCGRIKNVREGQRAVTTVWLILILGAVGFVVFFSAFGGVFRALEVARAFRTGAFEITNPWSFMRPVGDFTKVAMLLFVAVWLSGRRTMPVIAGLIIAFLFSFLMIFFQGGRLGLALHVAVVMILFVSSGYLSIFHAAVIGTIASITLFFGYQIFFFIYGIFTDTELRIPDSIRELTPLQFYVLELSFPAIGLATSIHAVENNIVPLRFGAEIFQGIASILPSRFVDLGLISVGALHTAFSNPGGGGSIPVDMIIYGIYSFYIPGPAIMALVVGFCTRIVFRYLARIPWPRIRFALEVYLLFSLVRHLVYFDPASSINSMYFIVICAALIYVVSRRSLKSTADHINAPLDRGRYAT